MSDDMKDDIVAVNVVHVPLDVYLADQQQIADLESQLAEARRHNELLRAVALTLWESYGLLCDWSGELTNKLFIGVISGFFVDAAEKMQAAIDGGAMEVE